jgi:glycosyltransferase involved in cell wall biosynthesis
MIIIIIPDQPDLRARRYLIADQLAQKGHEVHFIMWEFPYHMKPKELVRHLFTSMLPKRYKHERIIVHKIGRLPYFWPYVNGILFKIQLRRIYKAIGADIIFTESYSNENEVPKDLPFIYDLADDYAAPADLYGSLIYKLAFKLLDVKGTMRRQCENALAVTVLSEILFNYAKQYNDEVFRLYDGVDDEPIRSVLEDLESYPDNPHSIIYATGFGQWSRVIETMQSVTELRDEFPSIDLTLLGDGIMADKMRRYIIDNDATSYIHFPGYVWDRLEFFRYINKATIGLNISEKNKWRDAAHPLKVMEYTAMGKKIVSTNLAEIERLKFENIFIFDDSKGIDSFKNSLRSALLYKQKKGQYDKISKHVMAEYSWDKINRDLINLIEKVNN